MQFDVRVFALLCSCSVFGCNTPSQTSLITDDPSEPGELTVSGPLIPSNAIPADVGVVLIARSPVSLFETAMRLDWLGPVDPAQFQAFRDELDAFTTKQIGVKLTNAREFTVFMQSREEFGAIILGVEGQLTGKVRQTHGDTPLYELDGDVLAASSGELLLLGDDVVILAMLDALAGTGARLADGEDGIADLFTRESDGAWAAVALDRARLPKAIGSPLGIDRGLVRVSDEGIRAVAYGPNAELQKLVELAETSKSELLTAIEREKQQSVEGDDVLAGITAIATSHTTKRLTDMLDPKLEGDRLSLDLPIHLDDPAIIVALVGVGAAAALPAFQKVRRRATTDEARLQIAKMYDAVVTHFRGAQQCPSAGQLVDSAGLTPPLSVACAKGPDGFCVPDGSGLGGYAATVWADNPIWKAMDFQIEQPHKFHYDVRWQNEAAGPGTCWFTVQAFADLDDDGIYSTYERSGAAGPDGVNAGVGLYIDRELE